MPFIIGFLPALLSTALLLFLGGLAVYFAPLDSTIAFVIMKAAFFAVLAAFAGIASAHIEMSSPAPLRSKHNPNAGSNIDYSMTSPLEETGSNFPCKGYLSDADGKQSVAKWQAGSSQQVT